MTYLLLIPFLAAILFLLLYLVLIFLFIRGWKKLNLREGDISGETHSVSLVIACRNEENTLPSLLNDITALEFPSGKFEVILVNDGSEDRTSQLIQQFIIQHPEIQCIRVDTGSAKGKKEALMQGIHQASGEWILCTDADCSLPKRWIPAMFGSISTDKILMVLGPIGTKVKKGFWSQFQQLEMMGLVSGAAGSAGMGRPFLGNGANMMFKRQAFLDVAGYLDSAHLASGDDVFLIHDLKKKFGSKCIRYSVLPECLVYTEVAPSFKRLLRQRVRWASKSKYYKDSWSIMVTAVMLLSNLSLLLLYGLSFANRYVLFSTLVVMVLKGILDRGLIGKMSELTGQKVHPGHFMLSQILYPFYTALVAIVSWKGKYEWKGIKRL